MITTIEGVYADSRLLIPDSPQKARAALAALADMHADWWDRLPDPKDYPWLRTFTGGDAYCLADAARSALLAIECAEWGGYFFTKERLGAWLRVLDNPRCLLDSLEDLPQTLIRGDWGLGIGGWGFLSHYSQPPTAMTGPAVYDLACLHSLARWRFGRAPLSLVQMRNCYLERLRWRLGELIDRYAFDLGVDAARAWRFAVYWPAAILEHHGSLLAQKRRLHNAVMEPAYASLRRCTP